MLLARLFGAALLSFSVMCWAASRELGGPGVSSHVAAMLIYNVIVAALLVYAGMILGLAGVGLWPAVAAHGLLEGWRVAGLTRQGGRRAHTDAGFRRRTQ